MPFFVVPKLEEAKRAGEEKENSVREAPRVDDLREEQHVFSKMGLSARKIVNNSNLEHVVARQHGDHSIRWERLTRTVQWTEAKGGSQNRLLTLISRDFQNISYVTELV